MTHELKKIFKQYEQALKEGKKAVLASVVALEGSSYRRPGVRMLILDDGQMVGAVSGGCVEKEIRRQAEEVFSSDIPKIMTYDGRYRLGCEGILYILIEPFRPGQDLLEAFGEVVAQRAYFDVHSFFKQQDGSYEQYGSVFNIGDRDYPLRSSFETEEGLSLLTTKMPPSPKLVIIGTEHDAVQLSSFAALAGWEVSIWAYPSEEKAIEDFPGANTMSFHLPEELQASQDTIDRHTAIVIMTHSFSKDIRYLLGLYETSAFYLGLLGPATRREKLLNELLERHPEVPDTFFDKIHGPAGLDIGSETPQEISIAILAEITAVLRSRNPMSLKDKKGKIHS